MRSGMKMRMMAVGLLSFLLTGCPSDVDDAAEPSIPPDTIVIGLLQPFPTGVEVQREQAARLAIEEINAAGGVNGKRLALKVAYDSNNDPVAGVAGARHLLESGVIALIGANASRVTLPVAEQVTIPAGVALISPGSTSPLVSTLADNDTVYRIPPSDALQGRLLAELVWGEGRDQIAIFAQDEPYGQGLSEAFRNRFLELGGTIQTEAYFPPDQTSGFSSQIDTLYSEGTPGGLMLFAFSVATSNLLREIVSAKGSLPVLYGVDANMSIDMATNAPAQVVGMRGTTPSSAVTSPAYQRFLNAFVRATGEIPSPNRENAYDAVYLIALSLAQAGQSNRSAVVNHLRAISRADTATPITVLPQEFAAAVAAIGAGADINYQGASGPVDFDAQGDPSAATYRYQEIRNSASGLVIDTLATIDYP